MSKRLFPSRPAFNGGYAAFAFALVVVVHLSNAAISAWFGYLSPDSWTYLRLAKGFQTNFYPSLDHNYFAVFPFGYPLLLAVASPGLDLVHTAIVSKFLNALLWISTYVFLRRLRIPALVAAALVITPFALFIAAMSWSENLMIFALVLTLASIDALQSENERPAHAIALLAAALITGISSRYAFGFIAGTFLAAYIGTFRMRARRDVILTLILSGAFFVLYLAINAWLTGHATGMDRGPSTAPLSYLGFTFASANLQLIFSAMLPFAFVALIATRDWRAPPLALMTGLVGIAYVAIITVLRLRNQFDPFDERLLGPGWLLLAIAIALTAQESADLARRRIGATALILLALWSTYAAHGSDAVDLINSGQMRTSLAAAIENYTTAFTPDDDDAEAVITVATPPPRPTVHGDNRLYYGDLDVFEPLSAPLSPRETLDAFTKRVRSSKINLTHCAVDFSHFASDEDLSEVLDEVYPSGLMAEEPVFDRTLAERFHRMFRARALVPCASFLDGTPLSN